MRKIVSKEEEEKRRKRNQIILGVVLAFVMLVSALSFAFQERSFNTTNSGVPSNKIDYNGFKFINQNGLWYLGNFSFTYLPQEVNYTALGINPITSYQGKPVYIYSENQGAEVEVTTNIGLVAQRVQKACPVGVSCDISIPVRTCSDNFIIIREGSNSSITQKDNCVLIEGQKKELTALADQFLFKTLGIK